MRVLTAVRFVAVFTTGLLAGLIVGEGVCGFRMFANNRLRLLGSPRPQGHDYQNSPASILERFQRQYDQVMPILIGIAILACVTWLFLVRSRVKSLSFVLLALSTLGWVSVLWPRVVDFSIYRSRPTTEWPAVFPHWAPSPWEYQLHSARPFIAVLAFALELLTFGLIPQRKSVASSD